MKRLILFLVAGMLSIVLYSQEEESQQSRDSQAMDATATQWSFQLAYQWMPDYYQDMINDTTTRPLGLDNYLQLRIVAPVPLKGLTILPRLTLRHYEDLKRGNQVWVILNYLH